MKNTLIQIRRKKGKIGAYLMITIFLLAGLQSCDQFLSPHKKLRKAWKEKDTTVVLNWVDNLNDTLSSDKEYYDQLVTISSISGFYFGNVDLEGEYFKGLSKRNKKVLRLNTAMVYGVYAKSCLFMKDIAENSCLSIQDSYWSDSIPFTHQDLKHIAASIDSLCVHEYHFK